MKAAVVKSNKPDESRAAANSIFQKKNDPKGALGVVANRPRPAAARLASAPIGAAGSSTFIRLYAPSPVIQRKTNDMTDKANNSLSQVWKTQLLHIHEKDCGCSNCSPVMQLGKKKGFGKGKPINPSLLGFNQAPALAPPNPGDLLAFNAALAGPVMGATHCAVSYQGPAGNAEEQAMVQAGWVQAASGGGMCAEGNAVTQLLAAAALVGAGGIALPAGGAATFEGNLFKSKVLFSKSYRHVVLNNPVSISVCLACQANFAGADFTQADTTPTTANNGTAAPGQWANMQ